MSTEVVVYGFETSNNMKVRVALGYKRIPYEFRSIDPGDRKTIVKVSGQYLTPVLVHGERVLFDSAAILRYLDANFPGTPKLYGDGHEQQWEIEDWELFARVELARPMMEIVHRRVHGHAVDDAMVNRCSAAFGEAVTTLAERLEGREWLVGNRMSAADITAAAVMARVQSAEMFPFPAAVDGLAPWREKVMCHDGAMRS